MSAKSQKQTQLQNKGSACSALLRLPHCEIFASDDREAEKPEGKADNQSGYCPDLGAVEDLGRRPESSKQHRRAQRQQKRTLGRLFDHVVGAGERLWAELPSGRARLQTAGITQGGDVRTCSAPICFFPRNDRAKSRRSLTRAYTQVIGFVLQPSRAPSMFPSPTDIKGLEVPLWDTMATAWLCVARRFA